MRFGIRPKRELPRVTVVVPVYDVERWLPASLDSVLGQSSVDLMMRNGNRIRARLGSSCPALDYYSGFYITPGEDGFVCAGRETIRSRAGGQCEIDMFRLLRPVAKD